MSNVAAIRRQLFGSPVRSAKPAMPYDHMSKAALWSEVQALRAQLAEANRLATVARNAIGTEGTEGTPAYRMLAGARETLRGLAAATEARCA